MSNISSPRSPRMTASRPVNAPPAATPAPSASRAAETHTAHLFPVSAANEPITIGRTLVGPGHPTFVVAEMSGNHGGSLEKALQLVQAAKDAGANAIKLQTYRGNTITFDSSNKDFLIPSDSPWQQEQTLYALYEKAHTPWEWHAQLFAKARELGLEVFSSPFDPTAVDLLEGLDACAYKIASPEITDIPLLERVARTNKPIILSTGLAKWDDIDLAVQTLRQNGTTALVILKCTTAYPTPLEDVNLRTIPDLAKSFDCLSGLSDHTLGSDVAPLATAVGASMIEKHLVLDTESETVDSFFSLDTQGFKSMVEKIRNAEQALGRVSYDIAPSAQPYFGARRSLYPVLAIKQGEVFTEKNVRSVRPGHGMHPKDYHKVLGQKAAVDLNPGDRLSWDVVEKADGKQN